MFICKSRQRHLQREGRIFFSRYHQFSRMVKMFQQQTGPIFLFPLEEAGHWTNSYLMRQVFADIYGKDFMHTKLMNIDTSNIETVEN